MKAIAAPLKKNIKIKATFKQVPDLGVPHEKSVTLSNLFRL